jgi:hypothetical protein
MSQLLMQSVDLDPILHPMPPRRYPTFSIGVVACGTLFRHRYLIYSSNDESMVNAYEQTMKRESGHDVEWGRCVRVGSSSRGRGLFYMREEARERRGRVGFWIVEREETSRRSSR